LEYQEKRCTKCKKIKPIEDFHKQKGRKYGSSHCKECNKEYFKNNFEHYQKIKREYYKNNREREIKRTAQWRIDNPEKKKLQRKREYANKREEFIRNAARWAKENPDKRKEIANRWSRNNPEHRRRIRAIPKNKINHSISSSMRLALNGNKNGRKWESLVPYNLQDLIKHLENKFLKGMNWNNYGRYGWNIDHIIPIDLWEFEKPEDSEFKQCWALCNLQPLWEKENQSKSNKII